MHDADAQGVPSDARDKTMMEWVLGALLPLVGHATAKNWELLYANNLPMVLGILPVDYYGETAATTQFWRQRMLKVASHESFANGTIRFAIADSREYAKSGLLQAAGLADNTAEMSVLILGPAVEGGDPKQPQLYPLVTDDDVSEKQLRRFVTDYLDGNVQPVEGGGSLSGGGGKGKNGKKGKGKGQQQPVSGMPSPAPAPAPLSGVSSPVPSGVPSPAPKRADEL